MSIYREAEIGEDFVEPSSLSSHRSSKIEVLHGHLMPCSC